MRLTLRGKYICNGGNPVHCLSAHFYGSHQGGAIMKMHTDPSPWQRAKKVFMENKAKLAAAACVTIFLAAIVFVKLYRDELKSETQQDSTK